MMNNEFNDIHDILYQYVNSLDYKDEDILQYSYYSTFKYITTKYEEYHTSYRILLIIRLLYDRKILDLSEDIKTLITYNYIEGNVVSYYDSIDKSNFIIGIYMILDELEKIKMKEEKDLIPGEHDAKSWWNIMSKKNGYVFVAFCCIAMIIAIYVASVKYNYPAVLLISIIPGLGLVAIIWLGFIKFWNYLKGKK